MERNGTQHIAGEEDMRTYWPKSNITVSSITIPNLIISKAAEGTRQQNYGY